MTEAGFIVTPSEIADRVAGIDRAVQNLDAQITRNKEPLIDERFREAWRDFTLRWQMQRDAFESAGSRVFASRAVPILDDWTAAVRRWLADFQRRIRGAASPPAESAAALAAAKAATRPSWTGLLVGAAVGAVATFLLMRPREVAP
jgi:hypothetical protein